jgi:CDP-diacylglycerol--glycerol-3-phosphate 3-phosphatidyltransferase
MSTYRIKPYFQTLLQPLVERLVQSNISPDWLTGGAVLVAAGMGAGLLLANQQPGWLWLVALGALLRLTLNALDGQLARQSHRAGPWGEVKNELGDRLADALIFGALALAAYTPTGWAVAALVVALLSGYVGILGKAVTGQREYGGPFGKPDRMLALALTCLLVALTGWWSLFTLLLALVILLSGLTIVQRLEVIHGRC